MRHPSAVWILAFLGAVGGGAAGAAETAPAATAGPRALTLAEFRRQVAEANQSIYSKRLELEISRTQARGERGLYEPGFVGSASQNRTERENSIEQALNQNSPLFLEDATRGSAGVEGLLPMGGKYWVGASLDDLSNNLTNYWTRTSYIDQYLGFAGVRLTQPLLKNAGQASVLARVRLADAEVEVKHQAYRRQMMSVIAQGELAYWTLALAHYRVGVRRDSMGIAGKILDDNRRRVAAGKMSEVEVFEAEAGVAGRRAQLEDATQEAVAAANLVRTFLSESADGSPQALEAADRPEIRAADVDFPAAMKKALLCHPDYLAQLSIIRQEEVRVAYARTQRWPQLDLVASYGLNGLGESADDAFQKIGDAGYEAWSVGAELRIPLGGGIRERADLAAAKQRKQQALVDLKTAEIQIGNTLQTVLRQVESTKEQADQQKAVADIGAKLLQAEMGRLDGGKSDSRRVLQIEQELVDARLEHMRSLVAHCKAWLDLEIAEGVLLEARSLEPDPPRRTGK